MVLKRFYISVYLDLSKRYHMVTVYLVAMNGLQCSHCILTKTVPCDKLFLSYNNCSIKINMHLLRSTFSYKNFCVEENTVKNT